MVLATSKSLSLMAASPSDSPSVSPSATLHGPRLELRTLRRACCAGSVSGMSERRALMRDATTLCADSLRERTDSRARRIAAVRSASACDQTVRQTPWYVMLPAPRASVPAPPRSGEVLGATFVSRADTLLGPRYAEEGRAWVSAYEYGKVP